MGVSDRNEDSDKKRPGGKGVEKKEAGKEPILADVRYRQVKHHRKITATSSYLNP